MAGIEERECGWGQQIKKKNFYEGLCFHSGGSCGCRGGTGRRVG